MMGGYYVVWVGRKPGVYETWNECRAQTEGLSGCQFKGNFSLNEVIDAIISPPPNAKHLKPPSWPIQIPDEALPYYNIKTGRMNHTECASETSPSTINAGTVKATIEGNGKRMVLEGSAEDVSYILSGLKL
ncbi:hypothetical protein ACLB2K_003997 [Fragaria x ananassa]